METSNTNPLRSLTRLLVGGVVLGLDELQHQLQLWERTANRRYARHQSAATKAQPETTAGASPAQASQAPPASTPHDQSTANRPDAQPEPAALTPAETIRYAMIGLLFDTQQRMEAGFATLERVDRVLGTLAAPLVKEMRTNRALAPARERFEELVARGEAEVTRLVELGRTEETRSQILTTTAAQMSFEASIHQVAINPEVQELVQKQGIGLASEVVEEVRERAVSADTLLERLARSLLGRVPREQLPEPPAAVRIRAEHLRSVQGEG